MTTRLSAQSLASQLSASLAWFPRRMSEAEQTAFAAKQVTPRDFTGLEDLCRDHAAQRTLLYNADTFPAAVSPLFGPEALFAHLKKHTINSINVGVCKRGQVRKSSPICFELCVCRTNRTSFL